MRADPAVLLYLRNYIADHGYAPSVREICAYFGWTAPSTGKRKLDALAENGYIERVGPRAIRLLDRV